MAQAGIAELLAICDGAMEREGAGRETYLDAACAGNPGLRREVEAVLARQGRTAGFLDTPPWSTAAPPLDVGQRLGPYVVTGVLGAGGMGRVYRARDARLGRTVALKVIGDVAGVPDEVLARFQLEARAIASLNHPNICALHDVGRAGGIDYLVMECVEGETLAARLLRGGGIPFGLALDWAAQLADALARAHKQGIVHRDLKPANVMLTKSGVKLLDFGLARLEEGPAAATDKPGLASAVAGTLPYMAPEQLHGQEADPRTDVFAFGAVLYEMVSGRQAFEGENEAAAARAVLYREPPRVSSIVPDIPASFDRLVARCLAKDPDDRWQSTADLAAELRWAASAQHTAPAAANGPSVRRRGQLLMVAGGAALLLTAAAAAVVLGGIRPVTTPGVYRFSVTAPPLETLTDRGVAISPDGRVLAYIAAARGSVPRLYLHRFNQSMASPAEGTEGASAPFFSPDGRWVAYSPEGGGLAKVPVSGGPPQRVWASESRIMAGASWGPDGILFGRWPNTGLSVVSREGGDARALTTVEKTGDWQMWPEMLPGGKAVLFTNWRRQSGVAAVSLPSGAVKAIVRSATRGRYLATGHLVYESGGDLLAVGFDPVRLETRGEARAVVTGIGKVAWNATSRPSFVGRSFDISPTGTLVYTALSGARPRLVWKDREGRARDLPLEPGPYSMPALSPDGRRVADTFADGLTRSIWIGDADGGAMMRLTPGDDDCYSLFSPDGQWVVYTSNQDDRYNVYRIRSDGSGAPERLTDSVNAQRGTSYSPDGRILLLNDVTSGANSLDTNISARLDDGRLVPVVRTPFLERGAVFSPDGRHIAYESNESGRLEVYVQRYPAGAKAKVSRGGGRRPMWAPRGGELFFQGAGAVMAVAVVDGVPAGAPQPLFSHTSEFVDWAVAPDGRSFLVVEGGDASKSPPHINVVVNWFEELRTLAPVGTVARPPQRAP